MRVYDARQTLERQGLVAVVTDSGYNKTLPSGTVLEQTPANNSQVKPGREIYLTINTTRTPTLRCRTLLTTAPCVRRKRG